MTQGVLDVIKRDIVLVWFANVCYVLLGMNLMTFWCLSSVWSFTSCECHEVDGVVELTAVERVFLL